MSRSTLALLSPLRAELEPSLKALGTAERVEAPAPGSLWRVRPRRGGASEVLVGWSGVGRRATEAAVARLAELRPVRILHLGVAGGLDGGLQAGDALLLARIHHEGDQVSSDLTALGPGLVQALMAAGVRTGAVGVTVGRVVTTPASKRALAERYAGAAVVEMESFWAARAAAAAGVPLLCLRVVCDGAGEALPDLTAALDPVGRPRPLALLSHLARRPREALALPQIARAFGCAQRRLTEIATLAAGS